jgi:putative transposase
LIFAGLGDSLLSTQGREQEPAMARMPRLVVPGYPHHVTQRGNRRQTTFFCEEDYRMYLALAAQFKAEAGVEVWAYCLMPNHVHLVVVPDTTESLARFFRSVHLRYTRSINEKNDWCGHLWQERFHSFVMDEAHLLTAVRYVELNPVRAGLCAGAADWKWSSARAHLRGRDDTVVAVSPMLQRRPNWQKYLSEDSEATELDNLRKHCRTGRPAGAKPFIKTLETLTGRDLSLRPPGRKPAKSAKSAKSGDS